MGTAFKIEITGMLQMKRAMNREISRLRRDGEVSVLSEATDIVEIAKAKYVPIGDSRKLVESGFVRAEASGKDIEVRMGFGGEASAYALAVHEHHSSSSPPSWGNKRGIKWSVSGTGSKYLHKPLMASVKGMASRLASKLKR